MKSNIIDGRFDLFSHNIIYSHLLNYFITFKLIF